MNKKKNIYRMDFLTRECYPIEEMFRLTKKDGTLVFDENNTFGGRGIYLHKDEEHLKNIFIKGKLKRFTQSKEDLSRLERELTNALGKSKEEA